MSQRPVSTGDLDSMTSTSAQPIGPLLIDIRTPNLTGPFLLHADAAGNCTSDQPRSPAAASIIAAAAASREAELRRVPTPDRGRGQVPPLNTPSLLSRSPSAAGKLSSRRRVAF